MKAVFHRLAINTVLFISVIVVFYTIYVSLSQSVIFHDNTSLYTTDKDCQLTDVVLMGTSHVSYGVHPGILWEHAGIAAYNYSCDISPFWSTYYDLLDLLSTDETKPKLIVVDIYSLTFDMAPSVFHFIRSDNFFPRLSYAQVQRLSTFLPKDKVLDYFLQYPVLHTQYSINVHAHRGLANGTALSKGALFPHYLYDSYNNSYLSLDGFPDIKMFNQCSPMTSQNAFYLQKTIDLAREHNIPLLLIGTPYIGISKAEKEIYNSVEKTAAENNIDFIDFNENISPIGLEPATDFHDVAHLNYTGMQKFSLYLADYLKQNYNLADHRGDTQYASYETCADIWNDFLSQQQLREEQNSSLYLQQVSSQFADNTVVISKIGNHIKTLEISSILKDTLARFGITEQQYERGGTWVIKNERIIFDSQGQETFSYRLLLGTKGASLTNSTSIQYQTDTLEAFPDGITIFVYNTKYDEVLDAVKIDAYWPDYIHHFYPTMQPIPPEETT